MIQITYHSGFSTERVGHASMRFSGGETQVRLNEPFVSPTSAMIEASLTSADSVMELLLVTDALRRRFGQKLPLNLVIPYLPYARQDRVCAPGEALSLKVFCDLINTQGYERVEVWDAHSDVALALLHGVNNICQGAFVTQIKNLPVDTLLVAPDAGALKKISEVSRATSRPYIRADKTRDPATGAITGTTVYSDHLGDTPLLIVDDICDGGRTFIELAAELRKVTDGPVNLYVTHGIFSRGVEVFEGVVDQIYCPNVFPGVADHPLLNRI